MTSRTELQIGQVVSVEGVVNQFPLVITKHQGVFVTLRYLIGDEYKRIPYTTINYSTLPNIVTYSVGEAKCHEKYVRTV